MPERQLTTNRGRGGEPLSGSVGVNHALNFLNQAIEKQDDNHSD
jgi:hypothetical protein